MPSVTRTTVAGQFDIRIDLSDVVSKLKALPMRVGTAVVRRGLLAGARVIGEEARIRAPQPQPRSRRGKLKGPERARGAPGTWATGRLRKAIAWESRGVFRDATGVPVEHRAVVIIRKPRGGGRNVRRYAHLVEYGTKPHRMGKGAITRIYPRSKAEQKAVGAMHPGARPRPYLRPALDTKGEEAIRTIEAVVRRELAKEVITLRQTRATAGSRR